MSLFEFLRKRGLPESIVNRMEDEKIDNDVVLAMSDNELQDYIPAKGDRILLRAHIRQKQNTSRDDGEGGEQAVPSTSTEGRKLALIESLTQKKKFASSDRLPRKKKETSESEGDVRETKRSKYTVEPRKQYDLRDKRRINAQNASKDSRSLVVGFCIFEKPDGRYVQVRSPNGGGIRYLKIPKDTRKAELQRLLVDLFFPDGESSQGNQEDFTFDVSVDVAGKQLLRDVETVEKVMKRMKLKSLRCYLLAKRFEIDSSSEEELPNISKPDIPKADTSLPVVQDAGKLKPVPSLEVLNTDADADLAIALAEDDATSYLVEAAEFADIQENQIAVAGLEPAVQQAGLVGLAKNSTGNANEQAGLVYLVDNTYVLTDTTLGTPSQMVGDTAMPVSSKEDTTEGDKREDEFLRGNEVLISADIRNYDLGDDIDSLPSPTPPPCAETIRLHRGRVLQEMQAYYMDHGIGRPIEVQMLLPNGDEEAGEDNGGVLRDTLSEFWEEFYEVNTIGDEIKVPSIRHNMGQNEWKACAKVLVVGYRQEGYFPVKLAQPFLEFAMFGDAGVDQDNLVPAFMKFIPEIERQVLEKARNNLQDVDEEELLDVLETHSVRVRVDAKNIESVLKEVAHKQLIQGPAYVAECWHEIMSQDLKPILKISFREMREKLKPTTGSTMKLLRFPEVMTTTMKETAEMLKKYVKTLSTEKLQRFLRFTTGSDMILGKDISIRFVTQSAFTRRPTAHTCGCVLELSHDFRNFMDFRNEFNRVLESNVWVMDIV